MQEGELETTIRQPGIDAATLNRLILKSAVEYAILTLDADGRVMSWNEGAERILGWTEGEILGRSADVFFTPEDVSINRPEAEMRIADSTGRAEDMRWHMRKDGSRFWATGMMMPLDGASNASKRAGYLKIFRDQTSARDMDRRLRDLEERAALALRSSGAIGVWDFDLAKDIVIADAPCAVLYGVDPARAEIGASSEEFFRGIRDDVRESVRARLFEAVENDGMFDETYQLSIPTRRPRWVQAKGTLQPDGNGRAARMTGIVIDVTAERSELEHQTALLKLGDQLRDLGDVDEMARCASELLGRTLNAVRAGHGHLDETGDYIDIVAEWVSNGSASLVGRLRYDDFGTFADLLRGGETVVIEDTHTDPRVPDPEPLERLGIRSLLNVPLMERGRLKAVLFVNDDGPRQWTPAELRFVMGVFDRTYAAIERVRFEEQRDVMTREMAHRMKNMLSIAQGVATQSLRHASTIDEGRRAITGRLAALGRAQDMLTVSHHTGAAIDHVVKDALAPHCPDEDRLHVEGPSFMLSSQQVLGLSLALHELGTNATKYGAFSNEVGLVEVRWTLEDRHFAFTWTETGGPAVNATNAAGFGSTLLNRITGQYFDGESAIHLPPSGVTFELTGTVQL